MGAPGGRVRPRERGISYWTKNYRTGIEADDPGALHRHYEYYDPIYTLPEPGQRWWRETAGEPSALNAEAAARAAASRSAAEALSGD